MIRILSTFQTALLTSRLNALKQNIQDALKFLKKNYSNHLFYRAQLPWFIVAGAENSGKTSLLALSGLGWVSTNNQPVQQLTPTTYCQWFFNASAVLIDISGNLMCPEQPDATTLILWKKWISLLYRYRYWRALDGFILCVDLLEFQKRSDEQRRQQVDLFRYHIQAFSYAMPIYLIFTRCDRIQGFTEFFQSFSLEERNQPCGVSLPNLDQQNFSPFAEEQLNAFLRRLNEQVIRCLQYERTLEKRIHIKNFPLQLESKKHTILQLSSQLHSTKNPIQGIYFTSTQQEGIPQDALAPLLNIFSLPSASQVTERKPQKYNFFVKETLNKIIQRENRLEAPKKHLWARFFYGRSFYLSLCCILVLGLPSLWGSYMYNHHMIKKVQTILTEYQNQARDLPSDSTPLTWLNLLQKGKDTLGHTNYLPLRWSFHQADYLQHQLNTLYDTALNEILTPRLQKILTAQLQTDIHTKSPLLFTTLKVYLMLGGYISPDKIFLDRWVQHYADDIFNGQADNTHDFLMHFDHWLIQKSIPIQTDPKLIRLARNTLGNFSPTDLVYQALIQAYSWEPINRNYPALYLKQNFNKVYYQDIPARVIQTIQTDNKVLDENLPPAFLKPLLQQITQEVQALYVKQYIYFWQTQLAQLSVPLFKNLEEVYLFARTLNTTHSLMLMPLNNIKANLAPVSQVQAAQNILNAVNQIGHLSGENKSDKQTIAALTYFTQYLERILKEKDTKQAIFLATKKRMSDYGPPEADALDRLLEVAQHAPLGWKDWLNQLATFTWQTMLSNSQAYINTHWQVEVLPKYQTMILNRYPVFSEANLDISLSDFATFFGTNGILYNFFKTYLDGFVDTSTLYWQWKKKNNLSIAIPQAALEMLNRSELIRKMYFTHNEKNLKLKFSITPTNVELISDNIVLTLNGQLVNYASDFRQPKNINWPDKQSLSSSLALQLPEGAKQVVYEEKGDWGLFKLLSHATWSTSANPKLYQIAFNVLDKQVLYEILATNSINPFLPHILMSFRCPNQLVEKK